jgi:hypothetical protein
MGTAVTDPQQPIILREGEYGKAEVQALKHHPIWRIKDLLRQQLAELYEIEHPKEIHRPGFAEAQERFIHQSLGTEPDLRGNWIYFPWSGYLIHVVTEPEYSRLRTNRNQLLVTPEEQARLGDACIAVAGLSIGSHFVRSIALASIARIFKLAEFDTLSTSNLNRVQGGMADIGENKLDLVSRHLFELNPYQEIIGFPDGLTESTLVDFLGCGRRPDIIFEAIDDFVMKVRLRLAAREQRVPLVMLTNLGDSILVDVERYDLHPELPLFNGAIGDTPEEILSGPITEREKVRYAVKIVSFEYLPTRILHTLLQINQTLVGRPQLASTVTMGGGMATLIARQVLLGYPLPSGRYRLDFCGFFHETDEEREFDRQEAMDQLLKRFEL